MIREWREVPSSSAFFIKHVDMCLEVRLCVVASITTTASITAVNATCRKWLKKTPERSL